MRVIRTDFDRSQLVGNARLSPHGGSVSFAWIPTRTNASIPLSALDGVVIHTPLDDQIVNQMSLNIVDIHIRRVGRAAAQNKQDLIDIVRTNIQFKMFIQFMDFTLRGGKSKTAYYPTQKEVRNIDAIHEVIQQSIIVEYSPPSEMPLSTLLQKSTHAGIGYYIGSAAAGTNHWLMFLSVPAAIVVVGAAVGVSDGLVRGLPKVVETAVERWKPQPDPKP